MGRTRTNFAAASSGDDSDNRVGRDERTSQAANDAFSAAEGPIDYLQTKFYLYKFTPYMRLGGTSNPKYAQNTQTEADKAFRKRIAEQNTRIRTAVTKFQEIIANLNLAYLTDETVDITSISKAKSALNEFLSLPRVKDDVVVLTTERVSKTFREENSGETRLVSIDISPPGAAIYVQQRIDESNALGTTKEQGVALNSAKTLIIRILTEAIERGQSFLKAADKTQKQVLGQVDSKLKKQLAQFKLQRFDYDLSTRDLTRWDITKYLAAYNTGHAVGLAGNVGRVTWSATFENTIIPFDELSYSAKSNTDKRSVRRPIFFPDATQSPTYVTSDKDPITGEPVSAISIDEFITNLAILQTMEDGGGERGFNAFYDDIEDIEIAIRVRGIRNRARKNLILKLFQGESSPEIEKELYLIEKKRAGTSADAAKIKEKVSTLINTVKNAATASAFAKLSFLKKFALPGEDGIALADLIQKYDYVTAFVYKQEIPYEELFSYLNDENFFDKETNFSYASEADLFPPDKFHRTVVPPRRVNILPVDFSGFVLHRAFSETPGEVNRLTVTGEGPLALFNSSRRMFEPTIFTGSIFDSAEIVDSKMFTVFQNIFADKDPVQILEILMSATFSARARTTSGLNDKDAKLKGDGEFEAKIAHLRDQLVAAATLPESSEAQKKKIAKAVEQELRTGFPRILLNPRLFDGDISFKMFLDIFGMWGFNQFNEKDGDGNAKGSRNLFNMATFLYANVMRMRGFFTRLPNKSTTGLATRSRGTGILSGQDPSSVFNWQDSAAKLSAKTVITPTRRLSDDAGGSILEVSRDVLHGTDYEKTATNNFNEKITPKYRSFFLFTAQGLTSFVPVLKTPLEIMSEMSANTYLEFYETPGGRFILRPPEYNNNVPIFNKRSGSKSPKESQVNTQSFVLDAFSERTTSQQAVDNDISTSRDEVADENMITSEDILVIETSYEEATNELRSKLQLGYGVDLIGLPIELLRYHYTNGKVLSQYGLRWAGVEMNPNVRSRPTAPDVGFDTKSTKFMEGVFQYARFFLEYMNMQQYAGTVTAVASPYVRAGQTFYDARNHKFGYIAAVNKTLTVGGTYVMSLSLIAVRDAAYTGDRVGADVTRRVRFRHLPELGEITSKFAGLEFAKQQSFRSISLQQPVIDVTELSSYETAKSEKTAATGEIPEGSGFAAELNRQAENAKFKKTLQVDPNTKLKPYSGPNFVD